MAMANVLLVDDEVHFVQTTAKRLTKRDLRGFPGTLINEVSVGVNGWGESVGSSVTPPEEGRGFSLV